MNMPLATLILSFLALASPVPATQAHYSFAVNVVGQGKPMILIPGLSCGGDVWNSTVAHYTGSYKCYVLTLPGFAGQPAIEAPILPRVRDEIIAYINDNHLDHPVIIGHSLGATMAMWVAAEAPKSVGKVVAVDGVPCMAGLMNPNGDAQSIKTQAEQFRSIIAKQSKEAFAASNKQNLTYMITSPADVDAVAKTSSQSDPKSVGEVMYELLTTDLRAEVAKIQVPVLMVAEGAFFTSADLRKKAMDSYESQIHLIPNHVVKMSAKARHFVMLDDPEFFFKEIDDFLK